MPALSQTVAPEVSPELRQELSLELSVYCDLKLSADLLLEQMADSKAAIFAKLNAAGIVATSVDSIPLTVVSSNSNVLDKIKFVALGGSLKLLDEATSKVPRKPYLKITVGKDE